MGWRLKAAAPALALVLAPAAMAAPADDRSANAAALLGPSYLPTDRVAGTLPNLSSRPAIIDFSRRDFAADVGPRTFSNKLVGAWPVARDVHLGVGLMSVSRYSRKEPDFKREPMKDVGGRRQRIAAVGLSLSF